MQLFTETMMPIHDWTKVYPGIFHDFHQGWTVEIVSHINRAADGRGEYYALLERNVDVPVDHPMDARRRDELAPAHSAADRNAIAYLSNKNIVVLRDESDRIDAIIEFVAPGNKATQAEADRLIEKVVGLIARGIGVLLVDLFPATASAPKSFHDMIWRRVRRSESVIQRDPHRNLTAVGYAISSATECSASVQCFGLGDPIPDMRVSLSEGRQSTIPLEATYISLRWRRVIEAGTPPAASPS